VITNDSPSPPPPPPKKKVEIRMDHSYPQLNDMNLNQSGVRGRVMGQASGG